MAERSVNKAILVGRLGADAETRVTQNGTPVSRVSLAMNRQWTDSEKQVHEETDWMSIVIWNKENLATYLTKGTKLFEFNAGGPLSASPAVVPGRLVIGNQDGKLFCLGG